MYLYKEKYYFKNIIDKKKKKLINKFLSFQ